MVLFYFWFMKKTLTALTMFCFGVFCVAQEKIPFVDYDSVYEKVRESSEKGDYEKTLEQLDLIHKNDSTYCSVMVTKTYYLMVLERYDEAIALANEGIDERCADLQSSFYINKIASLLNQDKPQDALKTCEEGLKRFPQHKVLWYNKAVALETLGEIEASVAAYQKTMLLDPFYRKAYLRLGNICYRQERIGQAMMCFNMYLLLGPDSENAFDTLKSLNNIAQSKNENSKDPEIKISPDDGAFEDIDLILDNKIALNEKYDTGNEIDIALTKQNHALLQSLKGFSANGGFWDTKFVPFYQWVVEQELFDAFTYTLCYSIQNETYKKTIEKKMDEIEGFFDLAKDKWVDIMKNNRVINDGKEENLYYYFEDGYTKGIGIRDADGLVGTWELFNEKGRMTGKGTFEGNSKRSGTWNFYNAKGEIRESAEYANGELNGRNVIYYPNGRKKIIANYADGLLDGEYLYYTDKGALLQKKYFKEGALDGLFRSYHKIGEALLESEADYVGGSVKEVYKEYYPTGTLSAEINFKNGKAEGRETAYYLNGQLRMDLNSEQGSLNGYYKRYHPNGAEKEIGQTLDGNYIGQWKTFYDTGVLETEYTYDDKGQNDGEYKYFDTDGKLHHVFEYRRGELIAYRYYDKEGEIIEENRKKGGEFYYKGYSPHGKIQSEGLYDIKGGKKGLWKYYSEHGVLTDEGVYDDNKLQGAYKGYYESGELQSIYNYSNDTIDGYYANYHKNGTLKRQGWYKDDNVHGEWRSYTPAGIVEEINFYHKGELHGEQLVFSVKGVKTQRSLYEYGEKSKDEYYDINGNVYLTIDYDQDGEYVLEFQHHNKKTSSRANYLHGVKYGAYVFYDYYGRKVTEGNYLNGQPHGDWTWYHDNGNVETTANYTYGELDGDYTFFHEDGTLESHYVYQLGKLEGAAIDHFENGTIESKSTYHNDKRHGRREDYDPSGNLQLVRFYEYGRLIGYSYLDTTGTELPMKPIENESGKIVTYYDNGQISRDMVYENGYLIGDFKEYHYTGKLLEEASYAKGGLHGKRTEYFSNGRIKEERNYVLGALNGVVKEYFENGNLKSETTYHFDMKEGVARTYDKEGSLLTEETYFDDEIIASTSE